MEGNYIEHDGKKMDLRECIELYALAICKDIITEEERTEKTIQDCRILDSLSNALLAISS